MSSSPSTDDRLFRWLLWRLRHAPLRGGVAKDAEGWIPLEQLVVEIPPSLSGWTGVTVQELREFIAACRSERLELRQDKVRARYGHSVRGIEVARPATPPGELFHGTDRRLLPLILAEGLRPMGRSRVHLTADLDYARLVARPGGAATREI